MIQAIETLGVLSEWETLKCLIMYFSADITLKHIVEFGSKDTDLSTKSKTIQSNPSDSLSELTNQIQHKKSAIDAFEVADTIEPAKRLNEKVDKQNKIGTQSYDINIELFK